MRKAFVVLGIILLFAGVIVTSASAIPTEKSERSTVATAPLNEWEISGRLDEGNKLSVEFNPPDLDELLVPEPTLKLLVEVTAVSHGGKTVFEMEFKGGFGGNTVLNNVTVVSKEDGLAVSNPPTEVGGIVPYTDDYLANITTRKTARYITPSEEEFWAPSGLKIVKEVVHKEYPYLFVLPIGIMLMVVGGSLSFWGVRSLERKLRSRRKKR
jgi:hypothetical protein